MWFDKTKCNNSISDAALCVCLCKFSTSSWHVIGNGQFWPPPFDPLFDPRGLENGICIENCSGYNIILKIIPYVYQKRWETNLSKIIQKILVLDLSMFETGFLEKELIFVYPSRQWRVCTVFLRSATWDLDLKEIRGSLCGSAASEPSCCFFSWSIALQIFNSFWKTFFSYWQLSARGSLTILDKRYKKGMLFSNAFML